MRNYFCGWYMKSQNASGTLALIPAWHVSGGEKSCSLQLITEEGAWKLLFPYDRFQKTKNGLFIDGNWFGRDGVRLDIRTDDVEMVGQLRFGPLTPIRYDIMGPFRYVPYLQCRHSVFSMAHTVNGHLRINGICYEFTDGLGYMEGDRGRSFPREYLWTQCHFQDGSLMLSVAEIPFLGFCFTGVIGLIHYQGREYRLATYLGAKVLTIGNGEVTVVQGRRKLSVKLLEKREHPLAAPEKGGMCRTIHESASCKALYCFREGEKTVFSFTSDQASFENEYKQR